MITRLAVFDMAGTTVKDKGNVADSFLSAFNAHGIDLPRAEVQAVMGYRKIEAIEMLLRDIALEKAGDKALIHAIHDDFERIMLEYYMSDQELAPLPFAEELFQWLQARGVKVALNTGFTRNITEGILYRLSWKNNPLVNSVICSDEVPEGRPAPFMIRNLMDQFNIADPATVIKVGDTEVDILEGRNASCGLVISVSTGAYTAAQLEELGPDLVVGSLSELPAYIR